MVGMIPAELRAHLIGPDHRAVPGVSPHVLDRFHKKCHKNGHRVGIQPWSATDHERTCWADHELKPA